MGSGNIFFGRSSNDGKWKYISRGNIFMSYFESEQVDTSAFMTPEKLQQGVASILEEVQPQ